MSNPLILSEDFFPARGSESPGLSTCLAFLPPSPPSPLFPFRLFDLLPRLPRSVRFPFGKCPDVTDYLFASACPVRSPFPKPTFWNDPVARSPDACSRLRQAFCKAFPRLSFFPLLCPCLFFCNKNSFLSFFFPGGRLPKPPHSFPPLHPGGSRTSPFPHLFPPCVFFFENLAFHSLPFGPVAAPLLDASAGEPFFIPPSP